MWPGFFADQDMMTTGAMSEIALRLKVRVVTSGRPNQAALAITSKAMGLPSPMPFRQHRVDRVGERRPTRMRSFWMGPFV